MLIFNKLKHEFRGILNINKKFLISNINNQSELYVINKVTCVKIWIIKNIKYYEPLSFIIIDSKINTTYYR